MAVKRGLYFNGHSGYLDAVSVINTCGKIFTACFKFIPEKPQGNWEFLYSEVGNNSSYTPLINIGIYKTGVLKISIRDDDGVLIYHEFDVQFGNEYKLCMRYNGSKLKLNLNSDYVEVDGVLGDITITNPAYIGQQSYWHDSFYRGFVKWGVFYNRDLTDDEAEQVVLDERFPTLGLIAHYDFEQGHTLDLSGNNNHATPHNVEFVGVNRKAGVWVDGNGGNYVKIPAFITSQTDTEYWSLFFDVVFKSQGGIQYIYSERSNAEIMLNFFLNQANGVQLSLKDSNGSTYGVYRSEDWDGGRVIVGVVRNGNTLYVYRNEELLYTVDLTNFSGITTTQSASLGAQAVYWNYALKGSIRRVWGFDRAITQGEILKIIKSGIVGDEKFYLDLTSGTSFDLSNHNNDGQLVGNAKIIGVHSKSGLWFPGTSGSYLDAGNIFAGSQQLVVGVEFRANQTSDLQGIIAKWNAGVATAQEWQILIMLNGELRAYYTDGTIAQYSGGYYLMWGRLYKVIAVFDSIDNLIQIYVNGVKVSEFSTSIIMQTTTQPVWIGKAYDAGRAFNGIIKSAWIKTYIPANIRNEFLNWGANADAFWDFTTGSLKDQSGNGHDLTAYGDVKFVGVR